MYLEIKLLTFHKNIATRQSYAMNSKEKWDICLQQECGITSRESIQIRRNIPKDKLTILGR